MYKALIKPLIGDWDVSAVTYMFANITLSPVNYDALLVGWSNRGLQDNVTFDGIPAPLKTREISSARVLAGG